MITDFLDVEFNLNDISYILYKKTKLQYHVHLQKFKSSNKNNKTNIK